MSGHNADIGLRAWTGPSARPRVIAAARDAQGRAQLLGEIFRLHGLYPFKPLPGGFARKHPMLDRRALEGFSVAFAFRGRRRVFVRVHVRDPQLTQSHIACPHLRGKANFNSRL
jgi:hypothetical protein